jgi:hypothetical protein
MVCYLEDAAKERQNHQQKLHVSRETNGAAVAA